MDKILLAEDDLNFGSVLKSYLELNDYAVSLRTDGASALQLFRRERFDLCILDVMLPEMDGFSLAREIRKTNPQTPFIFLTAKTLKADVVEGFRTGADDYITKPFDTEVLLFKLRAILKRNQSMQGPAELPDELRIGKYLFRYKRRTLSLGEQATNLSPREAELLRMLCLHRNDVLKREDALNQIWGDNSYFTARSMDVFITKLRKYLRDDPDIEIITIHGNGFMLSVSGQAAGPDARA